MNNIDTITMIAQYEGRNLKPNTANISQVPNFTCIGGRVTHIDNYLAHDNADRLPSFAKILNGNILPNVNKSFKGKFGIELHDSNSYLVNDLDYSNVMVWSRNKYDRKSVLIPDVYQYTNYLPSCTDTINPDMKKNKIGFFGTTTGSRNPFRNSRIKMCQWSIDKNYIDCYITNIAQMTIDEFKTVDRYQEILHPYVPTQEQFKYKYLLDIPGNTYSWNRVPMILQSNSLLFKMPCADKAWYYPLLHPGEHYVEVDKDNIEKKFMYYENNPKEYAFIVENANRFVSSYLKTVHAYMYMVNLLEESHFWNRK